MITPALEILNQKGTPMFNSDLFANRPAAGIEGRIFIATDTKEFYRDTGTTWELLAGPGSGTVTGSGTATQVAFWNSASSLTGTNNLFWDATNNRLGINTNTPGVSLDVHGTNVIAQLNGTGTTNAQVTFQNAGANKWQIGNIYSGGSNYFRIQDNASSIERIKLENTGSLFLTGYLENLRTSTASASSGWHGFYSTENITIPAGTSFNNVGNIFAGLVSRNTMFYDGSASFAQANLTASVSANNIFNFNAAGSTITISQATGTRAYGAVTAFNWINGTNSGTITHLAGFHNLAPYQGSTGILNVTNYYGLLLNSSTERTAFTITNKWGIYQEGSSDLNYFASRVLIGSNVDDGNKLQVTGTSNLNGFVGVRNSNPQSLIDAVGQTGQLAEIKVTATGGGNPRLRLIGSGLNDCQLYYNYNLNIFASNTSVSALQLADTGVATFSYKVLINTSGNGELSVFGANSASDKYITLKNSSGDLYLGTSSTSNYLWGVANLPLVFYTNNVARLTIANTGAATFSNTITANSTTGISAIFKSSNFYGSIDLENTGGTTAGKWNLQSVSGTEVGLASGNYFGLYSYNSSAYRLLINASTGRVLINTQTDAGGYQLQTNGSILSTGSSAGFVFADRANTANLYTWYANTSIFLYSSNASANIASINQTTGVYTPLSDINKKKNIEPISLGLDAILKMNPVSYNFKTELDSDKKTIGLIAQEVKEIISEAYVENDNFIGLNYNAIIPVIIKAIQELNKKIN